MEGRCRAARRRRDPVQGRVRLDVGRTDARALFVGRQPASLPARLLPAALEPRSRESRGAPADPERVRRTSPGGRRHAHEGGAPSHVSPQIQVVRARGSSWKLEKYRRGPLVVKDASPFLGITLTARPGPTLERHRPDIRVAGRTRPRACTRFPSRRTTRSTSSSPTTAPATSHGACDRTTERGIRRASPARLAPGRRVASRAGSEPCSHEGQRRLPRVPGRRRRAATVVHRRRPSQRASRLVPCR